MNDMWTVHMTAVIHLLKDGIRYPLFSSSVVSLKLSISVHRKSSGVARKSFRREQIQGSSCGHLPLAISACLLLTSCEWQSHYVELSRFKKCRRRQFVTSCLNIGLHASFFSYICFVNIQSGSKKREHVHLALTLSNLNRFLEFFYRRLLESV